ncbi:DNA helicase-2/ATP-dependent DNA helicase PcrA [Pseudoduganella flava]|uniref:DNA 3'-5' helicase n=1 Tax=Pseudoduganella flava TaxID=871742 RepID=A0A562PNN8_9BURK|nr:ATP-dependent helicase [Pseudoduganella flava]QGZ40613.1 AAA family ATPase [Pseudoduganella flava]TWI46065.1 DNA helicase-2/ATP-dependent DNA helicase PcrA [Pseudoduganella flava]
MAHEPSKEQAEIIQSRANVILIDAVAGAGKTTTLCMTGIEACRRGLAPAAVTCLAFSDGAKKRFVEKLAEEGAPSGIAPLTIAEFALRHLRKLDTTGLFALPPLLGPAQVRDRLTEAAAAVWQRYEANGTQSDFDFGIEQSPDRIDHLFQVLRLLKATLSTHRFGDDDFASVQRFEMADELDLPVELIDICAAYERLREPEPGEFNWQTADDFVPDLVRVLDLNQGAAQQLWAPALYLIDEWHDVNAAEFALVRLLKRRARLIVVGDRDQVIDAARGAALRFSTDLFSATYPEAARLPLRRSRRFGAALARAASRLTSRPVEALDGLHTVQHKLAYDPGVPMGCARAVAAHVKSLHGAHHDVKLSDIAIVTREDDQSIDLENALIDANIPYRCEGIESYLLRPEILFMRALLHIVSGCYDTLDKDKPTVRAMVGALAAFVSMPGDAAQFDSSYLQVSRTARHDPLEQAIETVAATPASLHWFFDGIVCKPHDADTIITRNWKAKFAACVATLAERKETLATAADVLQAVRGMIDLKAAVGRAVPRRSEADAALRSIAHFAEFAAAYGNKPVEQFLQELRGRQRKLSARTDANRARAQLVLTTVRTAKGQEWNHVIVPYLQHGEFPRSADLAEERRFLYVAMTRAQESLTLCQPDEAHRRMWSPLLHGAEARA